MLISIIHGSLFFIFLDKMKEIVDSGISFYYFSILLFSFCMFIRVLQSQVLAAIRYEELWNVKTLDIFIIFIIAGFEYFMLHFISKSAWTYSILLITFALIGILGYIITFFSIKKRNSIEAYIQGLNIFILLVIAAISVLGILSNTTLSYSIAYLFNSFFLIVNIYFSIKLGMKSDI